MMKIGIITWFTYENFGTKLQAIALQKYLKDNKHTPILMNFEPPENEKIEVKSHIINNYKNIENKKLIIKKVKNKIYNFIEKIGRRKYKNELLERSRNFKDIIRDNCILSERIESKKEYINACNEMDCLVFGSDQIWNPNWFHPFYYANYEEIVVKKVAYAPSIGITEINNPQKESYQKSLESFSRIGIREKTGKKIIQELYKGTVEQVVDPTLLHTQDEWRQMLGVQQSHDNHPEKYICVYFLGENMKHWKMVYSLARKEKLKVKIIPCVGTSFLRRGVVVANATLHEFVEIISNAQYVITDSFHGTVFSVIFNRNFYTVERFNSKDSLSQNSRIFDFLSEIDLIERIIPFDSSRIDDVKKIDYDMVNKRLDILIKKSKEFLDKLVEEK